VFFGNLMYPAQESTLGTKIAQMLKSRRKRLKREDGERKDPY